MLTKTEALFSLGIAASEYELLQLKGQSLHGIHAIAPPAPYIYIL
jgi:hypothetical protein